MATYFDLGTSSAADSWRDIRWMRAAPPVAIKSQLTGHRKDVFHMALEQSQQQFAAAEAIGYESRPLNLFYGLAQAGRAIAAASQSLGRKGTEDREAWEPHGGHGLKFETTLDKKNGLLGARINVSPSGSDAFSRLSIALDSPLDVGSIEIGALLAQIPETSMRHADVLSWDPVLMPNGLYGLSGVGPSAYYRWDLSIGSFPTDEPSELEIGERLQHYPALRDLTVELGPDLGVLKSGNLGFVWLGIPSGSLLKPDSTNTSFVLKKSRHYRGIDTILPSAGQSLEALHPLATWWLVLFALSMLARYSPRDWSNVMNIPTSSLAPIIEYVLDTSISSVPELIADSLRNLNS